MKQNCSNAKKINGKGLYEGRDFEIDSDLQFYCFAYFLQYQDLPIISHASFHTGKNKIRSIRHRVFDDRLEIINPGGLPSGLSRKDFGRVSIRRNELLCDMFHRLDIVERAGTGIKRMRDAMKSENLLPPGIEADTFFTMELRRLQKVPLGTVGSGESREKGREKSREKIVRMFREFPEITMSEIAEKTGLSIKGIEKNVKQLKAGNVIRRLGPDKGGRWEVIEK